MEVNIHEAKSQLSRLIEMAMSGEEVVIAKAGNPMVRLVRIDKGKPVLGAATGQFALPEGWDSPLADDEVEELFGR
jgi:prevent-host-death family protein